jgi:hypothetical protein
LLWSPPCSLVDLPNKYFSGALYLLK